MDYKVFQLQLHSLFYVFIFLPISLCSTVVLAEDNEALNINNDIKLFAQAVKFSSLEQWSQAEPIYRELLKRNKQWPEPGNNLAILLLKTERIDEAKQVFEQAVSSTPSYQITQDNRSQLYNYLATLAYEKALGSEQHIALPELKLIQEIYQPEKTPSQEAGGEAEKEVAENIIKKEHVEKSLIPVAEIDSQPIFEKDISKLIKQQLLAWSSAWSQGDFENYIQTYSEKFQPSDQRKSYAEWKNIRRARLKFTKSVNIEIDQLRVFVEPEGEYALVEFIQNYHSESYNDKVLKQMYMHKQPDKWLILSERTIKKY